MDLERKPSLMGYWMPAEWEPHQQCWMGWPECPDNWRENARFGHHSFVEVASAISQFEPVTICVSSAQVFPAPVDREDVKSYLSELTEVYNVFKQVLNTGDEYEGDEAKTKSARRRRDEDESY